MMGLFDFVRSVGNKIFNRDEEAAEKIQQHVVIDGKLLIESRVIAEKMSFNPIR